MNNRIENNLSHTQANEEIIRAFLSQNVEFIVVGGLAVAWYCENRQADDMDLLINPTDDNSACITRALTSLRLQGFSSSSFTKPGLQVRLKQYHYADLLTPREDAPAYSEVAKDAVKGKLFGIEVLIASAASLIQLKEHAVASTMEAERDKHLKDIDCLTQYSMAHSLT